jgi:predicted extracellular nuclease
VYVSGITTRGYVATDGKVAVYVYTSSAPTVEVGDRVNFSGKKTTYYGLPEITNPQTDVVSKGNTVPYPTPKDITSGFDSYTADIAEYVTVEATAFKDGNYTNFRVAGATTYTLALSSAPTSIYDGITEGTKVQVTGYFNTINATRKQIQIIAVKVEKK